MDQAKLAKLRKLTSIQPSPARHRRSSVHMQGRNELDITRNGDGELVGAGIEIVCSTGRKE